MVVSYVVTVLSLLKILQCVYMYVSIDEVGDRTPATHTPSGHSNHYATGPVMAYVASFISHFSFPIQAR